MMPPPCAFTRFPSVSLKPMPGGFGGAIGDAVTGSVKVPISEPAATVQLPPVPVAPPVLLPPVPGIAGVLDRLDGLVLSGGGDFDPAGYGAQRHPETSSVRPDRDAAELALLAAALERGLPVLGICRGMQVINVAMGGSLHQHVPDLVGHHAHAPVPGSYGAHPVRVAAGSGLARILGRTQVDAVPTHHHQALDRLGGGLTATAWSDDGIIEAVELDAPGCPFAVAVQWHPEAGDDLSLFRALVAASVPAAALTP